MIIIIIIFILATSSHSNAHVVVKERTHREAIRFRLEWTIENFKTFQGHTEIMYSSGITMKDLGADDEFQGRWRIGVIPCWKTTEGSVETKYLSVFLDLKDSSPAISYKGDTMESGFHMSVTTGKAKDIVLFISSAPDQVLFSGSESSDTWGYYELIRHTRLFGTEKVPGLIKDDCINIVLNVVVYKDPKTVTVLETTTPHPSRLVREFTRRQLEWLKADHNRQFTDFVLVSSDNKEFPVHRFALMAHSPVFEAMFTHQKQSSRLELKDIDSETVALLLDYVYGCETGKINSGNAEKLLVVADQYEMMTLRAVCEEILVKNIPVVKAVQYLALAGRLGLVKLKEAALSVMAKNMGMVLKNGGLEAMQSDSNLLATIMEYFADKMRGSEDVHRASCT